MQSQTALASNLTVTSRGTERIVLYLENWISKAFASFGATPFVQNGFESQGGTSLTAVQTLSVWLIGGMLEKRVKKNQRT